jgi:hypothetical protein
MTERARNILIFIFLIVISLPAAFAYFHSGYFPTHDGEWAVVRLTDMFRTLRDFQIPARYSGNLNFGYGYPLFNFTYPFPYYFGLILHLLGFGFVNSIKILFAGSVIFSAFFMFLASKALWKNVWAGIASSILYIYFPYRMVDLYVRGSIGESLSFVLFPLLFYLAIKLINRPSFLLVGGIATSLASLIMTHNIMTVLFVPLYVIFVLIQAILENRKAIKSFIASIFLGLGISAFFWIPALFEKSNILLSQVPIADRNLYFVKFEQLIFSKWGYGIPTDSNGFSYQLGFGHIATFIVVVLSLFFILVKNQKYFKEYVFKITCFLVSFVLLYAFLLFKPSELLWKNIPLLSEINYPWIVLGILGFLISLLAGFLSKQVLGRYIVIFLGIIAVLTVLPHARPERYIDNPDSYYLTNDATTTSSNELMPLWVKKMPSQRVVNKVEITNGAGSIENIFFNSKQVNFSIDASDKTNIRVNTIYYPGWKVYVDKVNATISYKNEQGVMNINVPFGHHVVQAKFEETPLRLTGDILSLMSILMVAFLVVKRNKYAIS